MGWLGDGESYVNNQGETLASLTFSYQSGDRRDRRAVAAVVERALTDLEDGGYALAASPLQLTERGHAARLTGLSPSSVRRLELAIDRGRDGWMQGLVGASALTREASLQIAGLVYNAVEVFEYSLWMRRNGGSSANEKFDALMMFAQNTNDDYRSSDEFAADLALLASWISGDSYLDLARNAPVFTSASSLFGGENEPKRTSDATEYVGKLTYSACWVWSAVHVLASGLGLNLPIFIGRAIESGLPSEGATRLVQHGNVTRPTALAVSAVAGATWPATRNWIIGYDIEEDDELAITRLDRERLRELRQRLLLDGNPK
jgi:hypothetical protein